ncbi:MAG: tetratricopeptide repeat protein [Hydrococcus sp. SU_1_0]|nr:tetratricopeptide repeat protein [Hydrococcus sp. SU_1_0]
MKSTSPKTHWLDIAETSAVVGSIGGSITSIILKQWLWVTVPLSVTAGLAVINHQRLKKAIASEQAAMASLIQENHGKVMQIKQQSEQKHWDSKVEINDLKKASETTAAELVRLDQEQKGKLNTANQELQTLQASLGKLDNLTQKLEQQQNETRKLAQELKAIDNYTQIINNNPNLVEAYYQRGTDYQNTGNTERAIEDFSKVIELRNDHAEAYHQRGLLYMEIADAQKAIIDFRRASQYYIAKGDLERYRQARDLSLELHFHQSTETGASEAPKATETEVESVVVNNLFG